MMNNISNLKRDPRIDILRTLAIFLIILAHTFPPKLILNLRIFDVPLMAFLVGSSFVLSNNQLENYNFLNYFKKRFTRLVIPAWGFLCLFFAYILIFCKITSYSYPYTISEILTSFALLTGIGYVWIIRVFFILALFLPFFYKICIKNISFKGMVFLELLLFAIQTLIVFIDGNLSGHIEILFNQLIGNSFGYLIIASIGMFLIKGTKIEAFKFSLLNLFIFIVIFIGEHFPLLSTQKFPPSVLFISYGIGISTLLFSSLTNIVFSNKKEIILFKWFSRHSLELYYWHIFIIETMKLTNAHLIWFLKYFITILFCVILTYLQSKFFPNIFTFGLKLGSVKKFV